ncbi:MAG TPA: TIGR03435 family protein [Bryobacteraceae bacterium]|jgi:uncharacterized protein (TIGR03435 family)
MRSPSLPPLLALLVGSSLGSAPGWSQSRPASPLLSFDVASIKPNKSGQPTSSIRPGLHGRFVAVNATLAELVIWAYPIPAYRLEGVPGWVRSDRFDINAKVDMEENTTFGLFQTRLRHLLADRFHLATHTENREFPQFVLAVSKNGPKLVESRNNNCTVSNAAAPAAPGSPDQLPPCDFLLVKRSRMDGAGVTIARLTKGLSLLLKSKVIDQTSLEGHYDLHLEWTPDIPPAPPSDTNIDPVAPKIPGPSLFTALHEVGLELKSQRGLEDVLVIDHAEQPSEN